jgi:hypothetical protein
MPELEQQLRALALEIEWPPTPGLADRVGSAISLPARRGGSAWGLTFAHSRLALAAGAVILVAAALLAYAPSRAVIADWLNLHTTIQQVPHLPTPSPQPSGPLGGRLGLGRQTTLDQARQTVAWSIALPSSIGAPDEVYVLEPPGGPPQDEVTLVYAVRPGIPVASQTGVAVLVTEARGSVDQSFFGKILGPDTTLEPVTVSGHRGWWIAGAPHEFFFTDAGGDIRNETLRLATNTLILDFGGTVVRVEGNLSQAQALQIAASLG